MTFDGAVIKEQGVTFAIAVVKPEAVHNLSEASKLIADFQNRVFGNIPVVLMTQNSRGIPTYYGRKDITKFLSKVPIQVIPWQRYTLN